MRENEALFYGKHIATPVMVSGQPFGVIIMGRDLNDEDLDARDQQLVETLATQVAIALENRRLFRQTQQEQQNLRAVLETLPAGVLVLDPVTLHTLQFNQQVTQYLGFEIDPDMPFSIEHYGLYRTGSDLLYPQDDFPIFQVLKTGKEASVDDISVMINDMKVDLLMNAAPIYDEQGNIKQIVVAIQNITSLRLLENSLQENLRETVSLYEAQRQLAVAKTLEEVLDVVITHLILQQPFDVYILTPDYQHRITIARSYMQLIDSATTFIPILTDEDTLIPDITSDNRLSDENKQAFVTMGIRGIAVLPIRVTAREKPYGWLVVMSDESFDFGIDSVRVFAQLRDVMATSVDNRLLLESQANTVREVRLLYNATNNIARARDIDQLIAVLEEATATFNADYTFAFLDKEAGLRSTDWVLFENQKAGMPSIDFADIMTGYDIPPGGVYINDIEAIIERVPTEQALLDAGIMAFAAIHLRPKDVNSGFLFIGYCAPHQFVESEDRYLNTLADGASVILNTFILFEQIQSSLEETSTLYQASRSLADASNADEILDLAVTYLAHHISIRCSSLS